MAFHWRWGDLNGDGYADVVAGAYYYGAGGRMYVFHSSGTSSGVTITAAASASTIIDGEGGNFAYAVATADVNGDGCADVLTGADYYGNYAGRAYVFHSSGTSSGVTITSAASASTIIDGEASSYLGNAVAR